MRRTPGVSRNRKGVFALGTTLAVAGCIGFFICFIGAASSGFTSVSRLESGVRRSVGTEPEWFIGLVCCLAAVAVGQILRRIGARGIAGSGLVLDPERARRDLEPFARMSGGLVRDALEETGLVGQDAPSVEPRGDVVKLRCRECRALNDEEARFCDHCGAKL